MVRPGLVWHGALWQGEAGLVRIGWERLGRLGKVGCGRERRGITCSGAVWQGMAGTA
jgi:hypothetical protein